MASASSSFTGTENPLSEGGVWVAPSAYWQNPRKATGLGVATLNNDCARRYNPSTLTFTADQYSEITLKSVPTGGQLYFHYVMVRMNATAGCYLLTTAADVAANVLQLYRVSDAGGYTQLGANFTLGANFAANDVMRLEIVGTTLTVKFNGVSQGTRTDSTFSSGQPAVGGWAQTGSDVLFTAAWAAADITNAPDDAWPAGPQRAQPVVTLWQVGSAFGDDLPIAAAPAMVDEDGALRSTQLVPAWLALARLFDDDGLPSTPSIVGDETAPSVTPRGQPWAAGRAFDDTDLPGTTTLVTIDDDSAMSGRADPPFWGRGRPIVENDLPASLVFPLSVESGGRFLKQADGTPFLICGDSTWEIAVNLSAADQATFLDDCVARGINSVMANVIEHHYSVVKPPKDVDGNLPFTQRMDGAAYTGSPNGTTAVSGTQGQFAADAYSNINNQAPDCTHFNATYWNRIDAFISACAARNIAVFVWPQYLGFHGNQEGWISEITVWDAAIGAGGFTGQPFADGSKSKMFNYGAALAFRWASYGNIVWVAGGDYGSGSQTLNAAQTDAVESLIAGVKSVAGALSTLWTAHWDRPCISDDTKIPAAPPEPWQLNFAYSGDDAAEVARRAYAVAATKPAYWGEGFYEDGLFGGSAPFRKYLYWGFLGGIGGGFFGHEQLWRFDDGSPGTLWSTLLATQGRLDAARQFAFFKGKPWHRLIPNGLGGIGTLITAGGGTASPQSTDYVAAACTPQGDLLLAYIPPAHTGSITVAMSKLTGPITASWFDPTDSSITAIGSFPNTGTQAFTPPATNSDGDTDFLLLLETEGAVTIEEISPVQLPIAGDRRNNNAWWKPWWPHDAEDLAIPGPPPTSAIDDTVGQQRSPQPVPWLLAARAASDDDLAVTAAIEDDAALPTGVSLQPWVVRSAQFEEDFAASVLDEDAVPAASSPAPRWAARAPLTDDELPAAIATLDEEPAGMPRAGGSSWAITVVAADDDLPPPAVLDEPGWTFGTGWTVPNLQPPPPDPDDVPIPGPPGAILDEEAWLLRSPWPLAWSISSSPAPDEWGSGASPPTATAVLPVSVRVIENATAVVIIEESHG